jgi:hypothetical protein
MLTRKRGANVRIAWGPHEIPDQLDAELTPIDAHARRRHHTPGAPPTYQQEYAGELKQDADQHFTGAICDLYSCVHTFSIGTAQTPWVASMPYTDSCGDPSPNDLA